MQKIGLIRPAGAGAATRPRTNYISTAIEAGLGVLDKWTKVLRIGVPNKSSSFIKYIFLKGGLKRPVLWLYFSQGPTVPLLSPQFVDFPAAT